jgi:prolyl oligopeptidase PreP (S9A serine peptidase family)
MSPIRALSASLVAVTYMVGVMMTTTPETFGAVAFAASIPAVAVLAYRHFL